MRTKVVLRASIALVTSLWCWLALAGKDVQLDSRFSILGIRDPREVAVFLNKFKEASVRSDVEALSTLMSFPITVHDLSSGKSKNIYLKDKKDLKNNINRIFTIDVRRVIECQKFDDLSANWQGVIIGSGVVYIAPVERKGGEGSALLADDSHWELKVVGINVGRGSRRDAEELKAAGCGGN